MEAIILVGLQASGKSTFCKQRLFDSHIRINLDMLRTRHREQLLLQACLEAKQPFVVDNTNPTIGDRNRYIEIAKAAQFCVKGYYFASQIDACRTRNDRRERVVPVPGMLSTYAQLQLPSFAEGFDELYYVAIDINGEFEVSEWRDEV